MADGFRERFEAEIESLKTLRHDGIVRLYGYGEQDGVLFYSMELVEGTSLEEELKAGRRFSWREVSNIAIQIALALKHAHDHGIIHRDIKPANILLSADDRVKLADFGIARLFGATQLTTAGGVLGTADYMSPEQADGRPVTARCDQYSLGGVMYALLTGRPPFRAKNLPQMLQMQRFADPEPVRRYANDTPEQLERVVMQLLSKDPAARFPNTQVLARHLQAMYRALSRPAPDDFALPSDDAPEQELDGPDQALLTARTQTEPGSPSTGGSSAVKAASLTGSSLASSGSATHDAATLVAESVADPSLKSAAHSRPLTRRATPEKTETAPPARVDHFRTVEDDQALAQSGERSWILAIAQVAALLAVVGGAAVFIASAMRPSSADELYASISAVAEANQADSLLPVEKQLQEFQQRFPNDPRMEKIREFKERLALEQAERRLQRAQRGGAAGISDLLAVERLYLQAIATAQDSPAKGIAMLEALVALYGANTPEATAKAAKSQERERQLLCVQLAENRSAALRNQLESQVRLQLASLLERLSAAEEIAKTDPARAAVMYRAIIGLHEGDSWAAEIVAIARGRLDPSKSATKD
jgi:serine/threonine-protein kinase